MKWFRKEYKKIALSSPNVTLVDSLFVVSFKSKVMQIKAPSNIKWTNKKIKSKPISANGKVQIIDHK